MCAAITCKCSTKAAKHTAVMQVVRTKINTIHQVSKAMTDSEISSEEFTLITDEMDCYRTIMEEITKTRGIDEKKKENDYKLVDRKPLSNFLN